MQNRLGFEMADARSDIASLKEALAHAETVVIGAGAGLSTSAGFVYTGERFQANFHDFAQKYGFADMYSGGFYPYPTPEEHWAYWSRYIWINRYTPAPKPVYNDLLALVKDKDYFVLTTNVDHQFQKAGFEKRRLFYTQGDYGLYQCSGPCCRKTFDNEASVAQMRARQKDMRIPSELTPRCPICGKPMTMNLRSDATFVEDEGWHTAAERYAAFLDGHQKSRTLFLELGTGMNTPAIVKFPFWRMAYGWRDAVYACVNLGEAYAPKELESKAICLNEDVGSALKQL